MRLEQNIEEKQFDKDKRKDLRLLDEAVCTDMTISQRNGCLIQLFLCEKGMEVSETAVFADIVKNLQ